MNSLSDFRNLEKDWNGYGAEPFRDGFISELETLVQGFPIPPVGIFPTARGSIQFEWEIGAAFLEVEVFDNPRKVIIFTDRMMFTEDEDGVQIGFEDIPENINLFASQFDS